MNGASGSWGEDGVQEPGFVEFGNWETLERWVLRDASVTHWHGDRGYGDWTGTTFEQLEDAVRQIVATAAQNLRARAGLRQADWLLHRDDELPAGFSLGTINGMNVLDWELGGRPHRAWFGRAGFIARAVSFATVARVPVEQIEACALQEDSRRASRDASLVSRVTIGDEGGVVDTTLSRALVAYLGRGRSASPSESWEAVSTATPESRDRLEAIMRDYRRLSQVDWNERDGDLLPAMEQFAEAFRNTHPELDEAAIGALEWKFSWDWR